VALFSAEKDKPHRASSPGMFHSTEQWNATKKVPTGGISSFIHRVILGRPLQYQPPPQTHIHVSSEVKTSRTQMLMNEMDIPLSDQQAAELAHAYLALGLAWSRANTVQHTSLSQPMHNKVTEAFRQLNFVSQVHARQYSLTDAGYRFLRHFDPTPPPPHSAYVAHENTVR
jgi:hypothetical protein